MIHGVFYTKTSKRGERIYFPDMKAFLEYAMRVWDELQCLSADTVRPDQIRQGRNVKVMEGEKDG